MRNPVIAAIAFAAGAVVALPLMAQSTPEQPQVLAQAGPDGMDRGGDRGMGREHGPGPWRNGPEGGGHWGRPGAGEGPGPERGWHGRHGMMGMRPSPQEGCEDRLARRAGMRAYIGVKLKLTDQQRPLWDKLQAAAQPAEEKERGLCAMLKPPGEQAEQTLLQREDRHEQFLAAHLATLQATKPALQALYETLTPEQKALIDHPPHHGPMHRP